MGLPPAVAMLDPRVAIEILGLNEADTRSAFAAPRGSLLFPRLVATAQVCDSRRFNSLAEHFGISPSAMAIRLQELGMTED
jgi:hypothetical protein